MTNIAIGTLILGGLTSLGIATTASAAGPSIAVAPNTALVNGQSVAITGSGFADNESVYALECTATATSEADCDLSSATPGTTTATGTLSMSFSVITGAISSTTCGTSSSDLSNCSIVVGAVPPATDQAIAPITFALPSPTTTTTAPPVKIGPRKFHVAPVKNLKNGSKVKVWGTGFKPHDQVYVIECLATSKSEAGCDLKTLHPVKITATGVLPAFNFKVVTGKIGTGTCGTTAKNLKSCAISVANATKGDSGQVRIAFK
ncbi:MAG: neocarzinostatin apoprotein domain-containing protein [Acidimicrobiales bacterium]